MFKSWLWCLPTLERVIFKPQFPYKIRVKVTCQVVLELSKMMFISYPEGLAPLNIVGASLMLDFLFFRMRIRMRIFGHGKLKW